MADPHGQQMRNISQLVQWDSWH